MHHRIIIIILIMLLLMGCKTPQYFLRSREIKQQDSETAVAEKDILYNEAEAHLRKGNIPKAVTLFRRILVLDPDNEKVLQRINEIKRWVPMIRKRDMQFRNEWQKLVALQKRKQENLQEEKAELEQSLIAEEKEKKEIKRLAEFDKVIAKAGQALMDNEFDNARDLVKKAILIDPDSTDAARMWEKIPELEKHWKLINKLTGEAAEREISRKVVETEQARIESEEFVRIPESIPEEKIEDKKIELTAAAEIFRGLDKKLMPKRSKLKIEEILEKEFVFQDVAAFTDKLKKVEVEFLEEQSLAVYKKAVDEYKQDLKDGVYQSYGIEELKEINLGISEAFFWIGKFYEDKGDFKTALKNFKRIINDFNESPLLHRALYHAGRIYFKMGKVKDAYPILESVIDIPAQENIPQPDENTEFIASEDNYYFLIKESYLALAKIREQKEEYELAISLYEDLKDVFWWSDKVQDEALYAIGDIMLKLGEYAKAIEMYELIISSGVKSKNYNKARYFRFAALVGMGEYEKARTEMKQVLATDPLNVMKAATTYLYAETFFRQKDYTAAVVELQSAFNEYPDFTERSRYEVILAKSYSSTGLYKEALGIFQNVLSKKDKIDPAVIPEAYFELAMIYYNLYMYQDCRRVLLELCSEYPDNKWSLDGRYLLGDAFFAEKLFSSAEKQYRLAIVKKPTGLSSFMAKYRRAKCLRETGRYKLLDKFFYDSFFVTDLNRKEWDKSDNKLLDEYLKYYYLMLFEYGDYLMEVKKYKEAIPILTRVYSEYPQGENRFWSQYLVGKGLELSGDRERAIQHYQSMTNAGVENFWVDQAKFNLKNLIWDQQFQQKAVKLGRAYPEG